MEHRHVIAEAVKKFSSLAKGSGSRADFRKSFFPVTKQSRPVLRPWPSATNISHPAQSSTPMPNIIEGNPWARDSFKTLYRRSSTDSDRQPSVSSQDERSQEGVVNSAFIGKLNDPSDMCICDEMEEEYEGSEPSHQCQCRQRIAGHQLPTPEMIGMSVIADEPSRPRADSYSKYWVTRRSRLSSGWRYQEEKGLQRRLRIPGKPFRRRTTDSIPKADTILNQTRSSPNLRQLEEQAKTTRSLKIDRSCKEEDNSQL